MRFVFVDRIVRLEPARAIETRKNVSMSEDVFEDHFPGCPILPGALLVECFDQAAQILIAASHDWARVGTLTRISRGKFRHFVRPGDRLEVRCERRGAGWTLAASAAVDGRPAATATLEYALEDAPPETDAGERAARLRRLVDELRRSPLDLVRPEALP